MEPAGESQRVAKAMNAPFFTMGLVMQGLAVDRQRNPVAKGAMEHDPRKQWEE